MLSDWIRSLLSLSPLILVPSGAQGSVGCLHVVVVAVLRSNPRAWQIEVECSETENDAVLHFLQHSLYLNRQKKCVIPS